MKPTEILVTEHGLIRQALDSLSLAVHKLEGGERPPREFFDKALEFVKTFSDGYHHFKEEYVLFQRLAEKKQSEIDGQIDTLRNQHDRGRNYIAEIQNALPGYEQGKDAQVTIVLENLSAFVSLLRHHIHREDHVFYPMADQVLSAQEQEAILNEFEKEKEKAGKDIVEKSRRLVQEMGRMV